MYSENKLPQPTTIEQKYGALLGIMTGIIANEEITSDSNSLKVLIATLKDNTSNETEQFVLDQAQEYKEKPEVFPFGDLSHSPGWALQNQTLEKIIPQEVSTKIFDLSLPHSEVDIIVDALFFYQSTMQEHLTGEEHQRFESIYSKLGIVSKEY
ncbi:hypothetical protein AHMF7605_22600 [Adhaeribacter arboris]|uniref:Uncharacterized protein n=1 Tax=Adhaeribacter arboris TaxID=2072846 RepID=A0A2T2YKQ6_9BACT|nr:hypothetical protein [Adhaeribacter arboris]PSR56092.1 hypothetical protein AHMF7605_22600 [Adhaeribacter arboris]